MRKAAAPANTGDSSADSAKAIDFPLQKQGLATNADMSPTQHRTPRSLTGFPRAGRPRSTDAPRSVSAGETLPSKALQGRCPTLKAISFLASNEPQASVGGHVSVSGCTLMSAPTFSQNINENIRTQVGGSIMELTSIATHLTYLPFSLISGILFYYHSH